MNTNLNENFSEKRNEGKARTKYDFNLELMKQMKKVSRDVNDKQIIKWRGL